MKNFVKDSWKRDGRGSYCHACRLKRGRATRETFKEINANGLRVVEKYCPKCNIKKPVSEYFKNSGRKDGLGDWCSRCVVVANTCYRFNLTEREYIDMFEKQSYRCAWCGTHQDRLRKVLCVDHCHSTGKVRRLLCDGCNKAEGHLKHSPEILAAIEAVAWFPYVEDRIMELETPLD